mgnify:CR=1 FL=1
MGDPVAIGDPFFDVHTDKSVITVGSKLRRYSAEDRPGTRQYRAGAYSGGRGGRARRGRRRHPASHVTAVVADAQVEADFDDDEDDEPAEKAAAPAEMGELKLTPGPKST